MDIWRGRLSLRKAANLARWLPAGASVYRDMGSDMAWSDEAHMAANVFDVLQIANWQRAEKAPRPVPLQRPGDAARAESKKAQIEAKARAFAARQSAPITEEG